MYIKYYQIKLKMILPEFETDALPTGHSWKIIRLINGRLWVQTLPRAYLILIFNITSFFISIYMDSHREYLYELLCKYHLKFLG